MKRLNVVYGCVLLMGGGCTGTDKVTFRNEPPTAEITSPSDSATVLAESGTVTFIGYANDLDGSEDELDVEWRVGDDIVAPDEVHCPDIALREVATNCVIPLEPGDYSVTMTVMDRFSAVGSTTVDFKVTDGDTPDVLITAPTDDDAVYQHEKVQLAGRVRDTETPSAELKVWWTSDQDGQVVVETTPDTDGLIEDWTTDLSVGDHLLTLHALDHHGLEGTASVPVTVNPPNEAPDCEIDPTLDGSIYVPGAAVLISGTATDPNEDPSDLAVIWESSLAGSLGTTTPDSNGGVSISHPLDAGSHVISMNVEDERGLSCSDSAVVHVSHRPTIEMIVTPPDNGIVYVDDEWVTIDIEVNDDDEAPENLSLATTADGTALSGLSNPDATGVATFSSRDLPPGVYPIQVTVTDSMGLSASASAFIEINEKPGTPVIRIDPAAPRGGEDLLGVVESMPFDNDNDPSEVTVSWEWLQDGGVAGINTPLAQANTGRGEVWTAIATGHDPYQAGGSASASVTIGNGPPSLSLIDLAPQPLATIDAVSAVLTDWHDPDGDAFEPLLQQYTWTVNGELVAETGPSLGADNYVRGDTVAVWVIPCDAEECRPGPPTQADLVVGNAAPNVTASIVPLSAGVGAPRSADDLTIAIDSWFDADVDLDGADDTQDLTITWSWEIGGSLYQATSPTLPLPLQIPPITRGTTVSADVVPNDGRDDGPSYATSIVIGNTAPIGNDVSIQPSVPMPGEDLTAEIVPNTGEFDLDGDPVSYRYQWYANNVEILGETRITLSAPDVPRNTPVTVMAVPYDSLDDGDGKRSDPVTVENNAPTEPEISLPTNPESRDDLTCEITSPSFDADGDPITYEFTWFHLGQEYTGTLLEGDHPGDTMPSTATHSEQDIECVVVATDGHDSSDPVSAFTTIAPPRVAMVSVGDAHSCVLDSDGVVFCVGFDVAGRLDAPMDELFDTIHSRGMLSCGVTQGGADVECWGSGDILIEDSGDWPTAASSIDVTRILDLGIGEKHGCVLTDHPTDNVECFGDNGLGQSNPPGGRFIKLAVGEKANCAISDAGFPACWGNDPYGLVSHTPTNRTMLDIDIEKDHACAITENREVVCWGSDGGTQKTVPPSGSDFTDIEVGRNFSCARTINDEVYCWGDDEDGRTDPPDDVFGQFDSGKEHSCAVTADGSSAQCWGEQTNEEAPEYIYLEL